MKVEKEVKVKINKDIFEKLTASSGRFQFERTYGFFTENYKSRESGIFPRIKEVIINDTRTAFVTIKVKKSPISDAEQGLFVRDEYEFSVNNVTDTVIDTIINMFKIMGYVICEVFEKKRYRIESLNNCELVVDELPFGYFLEIEGEEEGITKTVVDLGLQDNEKISKAYLRVWEEYKKINNLSEDKKCIFE